MTPRSAAERAPRTAAGTWRHATWCRWERGGDECNCGLHEFRRAVAPAAVPLDAGRLAEAMAVNGISDGDGLPLFDVAERIAAEYASTGDDGRTPCPVCPHWLELHNPDGSCGCGMDCRARLAASQGGAGEEPE